MWAPHNWCRCLNRFTHFIGKEITNLATDNPQNAAYVEQAHQTEYWNLSKESKKEKILELYQSGMKKREIARIVGQSESCVRKWLKEME